MGLEQMADLTAQADTLLKAQGLTQGSVAERLQALNKDPRFIYPNTDEGKAKLIALLNGQMQAMEARLPHYFGRLPKRPVWKSAGCRRRSKRPPRAYYQPPALDGSRPGAYYINLRDTAEMPVWWLPTAASRPRCRMNTPR